jgi:hypothetical protein
MKMRTLFGRFAAVVVLAGLAVAPAAKAQTGLTSTYQLKPLAPASGTLDRTKLPGERVKMLVTPGFQNLKGAFEVLAPATPTYNCLSWSLGVTTEWLWPKDATVKGFDTYLGGIGYKRLGIMDEKPVPFRQKLVLFGKLDGAGTVKILHAVKVEADGTFTSKVGGLPLIKHLTLKALAGEAYGDPIAVYMK